MSTSEKLRTSFDLLAQRLHELEFDTNLDIQNDYVPYHSLKDILSEGILTGDLDDAQNLLLYYIDNVKKVLELCQNYSMARLRGELIKEVPGGVYDSHQF